MVSKGGQYGVGEGGRYMVILVGCVLINVSNFVIASALQVDHAIN